MSAFPASTGQSVGLEVFRIEKLNPVLVAASQHGTFYTGDCYIVLNTYEVKGRRGADVHFWLGKSSSQDERGAAAYRTVELDTQLHGVPVQHREVQGHESNLFLSYFAQGIMYHEGGVDSAFHHVDPAAYVPRLYQLSGKRNVRCAQVPCNAGELNEGDVFLLDAGLTLYQWNGKSSNRYEKFNALEIGTKIKDSERGGKAALIHLDSGAEDSVPESAHFWSTLGGKQTPKPATADAPASATPPAVVASLHQISDASGTLTVSEVGRGKLSKDLLNANAAFILDTGSELFVWIGKSATKQEREKAMTYAAKYVADNHRPDWTNITRIPQDGEPPIFKACFTHFDKELPSDKTVFSRHPGVSPEKKIEIDALFKKQAAAEEAQLDASGKVEVWRIENLAKVAVDPATYGQFFNGDSYIVLYSYKVNQKPCWIIYFWQGVDSSQDEKAASALLTVALDHSLGGDPVQVRVVEGKEPNHFLSLFSGKFVCHAGGVASGFKNRHEVGQPASAATTRLYHIRGTNHTNTRAVQVATQAASLNSCCAFAAVTATTVYVWCGRHSNEEERSFANNVASSVLKADRTVTHVDEGSEPADFWTALGGRGEYACAAETEITIEPRLFQFEVRGDAFTVDEVVNFSQEDLQHDGIFLLDTFNTVYVWVGKDARKEEKQLALTSALKYVQAATDGRSKDTPIFLVPAGAEPPVFSTSFVSWDSHKAADFSDPYQAKLQNLRVTAATNFGYDNPDVTKYTLAQVKAGSDKIDPKCKELYLSDAEFATVMGLSRHDYNALHQWKKDELRKKAGLF